MADLSKEILDIGRRLGIVAATADALGAPSKTVEQMRQDASRLLQISSEVMQLQSSESSARWLNQLREGLLARRKGDDMSDIPVVEELREKNRK